MTRAQTASRYAGYLFSVGGARAIGILISSLTFPFLVRKLGVEMYGVWSYIVAVCALLDTIANPGLTAYTQQRVASDRERTAELLPDIIALRVLSSALAILALITVALLEKRSGMRQLFLWYGPALFIINIIGCDHILAALELFHQRSALMVGQQLVYAIAIFAMVRRPQDVFWVPGSILFSALIMNVGGWLVLYRSGFRLPLALKPERWKGILWPSLHYAASSLMSNVYHRTGHLTVRWFLGDYALGLYAASVRVVDILRNFVTIILTVMMPRMALSARSSAGMMRLVRFATAVIALVSIPLTLGTVATAPSAVPLILGAKFAESAWLVRWMAPYIITAATASFLAGTVLYALGLHRSYLISTVFGAVAGISLYVLLTSSLGLRGAALAFVLAEVVVAIAAYVQMPRELHGLWKNPMIPVAFIAGLLMLAVVEALAKVLPWPTAVIGVGATAYLAASAWFVKRWIAREF